MPDPWVNFKAAIITALIISPLVIGASYFFDENTITVSECQKLKCCQQKELKQ